jgi:probable HAF family extracellular repeat protein
MRRFPTVPALFVLFLVVIPSVGLAFSSVRGIGMPLRPPEVQAVLDEFTPDRIASPIPFGAVAKPSYSKIGSDYGVVDLGGKWSWATALNDRGQVVGGSTVGGNLDPAHAHAVLWQDGVMTDLGTLGGDFSVAEAINQRGEIVGIGYTADGRYHAFLWRSGAMTDLGPEGLDSRSMRINNHGQAIVNAVTESAGVRAYLWQNGELLALGSLGDGVSEGLSINERGDVVGYAGTADHEVHAFLWRDGQMIDLGPGIALFINERGQIGINSQGHAFLWQDGRTTEIGSGTRRRFVNASNSRGQVVGVVEEYSGGPSQSFVWQDGVVTEMGSLGRRHSAPAAINESGTVVGWSGDQVGPGNTHSFIWRSGTMQDLGELSGWPASTAYEINSQGQVVGNVSRWNDPATLDSRAVLWQRGPRHDGNESAGMRAGRRGESDAPSGFAAALRVTSQPGRTPVEFALGGAVGGPYSVSVYDVRGEMIRTWTGYTASDARAQWDGRGNDGSPAGSGIYFVKVKMEERSWRGKVIVAR